jgi:hypothetical protein
MVSTLGFDPGDPGSNPGPEANMDRLGIGEPKWL